MKSLPHVKLVKLFEVNLSWAQKNWSSIAIAKNLVYQFSPKFIDQIDHLKKIENINIILPCMWVEIKLLWKHFTAKNWNFRFLEFVRIVKSICGQFHSKTGKV